MGSLVKRRLSGADDSDAHISKRAANTSSAAKFNKNVIKKLERALEKDPEVDLTAIFPSDYKSRLVQRRTNKESNNQLDTKISTPESSKVATPTILDNPAVVIYPLSDAVKSKFQSYDEGTNFEDGTRLAITLSKILDGIKIISRSGSSKRRFVGELGSEIVVKVTPDISDFTEYTSLQYLELHKPQLPTPRPQGLVVCGQSTYLFLSRIPGSTLAQLWPLLQKPQKESLSKDLDMILSDLRQLERPAGMALGGVAKEGCKDARRNVKTCETPFYSASDFWHFQYSGAPVGSQVYLKFLRDLTIPFQASKCVFAHGDLRMDNIIVQLQDDNTCRVSGIVDWEMSGFYPEDFECTKITNTFATNETDDWYLYLPSCVSPTRYPSRWLADFAWDKQVV